MFSAWLLDADLEVHFRLLRDPELLCAGDFARAVAKADEGIYELPISLTDRAVLYTVKSAALQRARRGGRRTGRLRRCGRVRDV